MDKEEFRVKLEEINRLVEEKDYKGAMNVVDSIDWRRVKSVRTLCVVGEIYAANKRYAESRDIFLLAYHRSSIGKNILYRLVEVSLKLNDFDEATDYYEEFCSVAPNDNTRLILKYKIMKAKNAPLEDQIAVLEKYKEREFTERWSYELAQLYYRAGESQKCEDLCNEMILWFSEGSYVMKALNLKQRMGVMTDAEKAKYEEQLTPKLYTTEELKEQQEKELEEQAEEASEESAEESESAEASEESSEKDAEPIESIAVSPETPHGAESFQEKITKGIRDIFGKRRESTHEDEESLMAEYQGAEYEEVPELEQEAEVTAEKAEAVVENTEAAVEEALEENVQEASEAEAVTEEAEESTPETAEEAADASEDTEPEEASKETEEEPAEEKAEEPKLDFAQTMRMPELKIPNSMRRVLTEEEPEEQKPVITEEILKEPEAEEPEPEISEPEPEEPEQEPEPEFNLEDAILAAATAQGIEIPQDPEVPAELEEAEAAPETAEEPETPEVDEEFEDFEEAEEVSFEEPEELAEVAEEPKAEIPDLQEEDLLAEMTRVTEEEIEEELVDPAVQDPEPTEEASVEDDLYEDFEEAEEAEETAADGSEEAVEDVPEEDEENTSDLEDFDLDADLESEDTEESEDLVEVPVLPEREEQEEEISDEDELERFIASIQPERDPSEIVAREKALTDEEKKLFSYFVKVPGMEGQLIDTLCKVQKEAADTTSRTGNIMIMGGNESGKTRLISSLIPAICRELNLTASKVAYVFADQINGKDLSVVLHKLSGGFFIVERANQMTPETAEKLNELMEMDTEGMIVILEDDKIGMRKLIQRFPKLAQKFTSLINIPVFTNDELAHFAKIYALEQGYKIDNMGMLALYNRIGSSQQADQPMNVGTVKGIVDSAISKSQSGFNMLRRNSSKRMDRDGFHILLEKDFK